MKRLLIICIGLWTILSLNAQNKVREWVVGSSQTMDNVHLLVDFKMGYPITKFDTLGCLSSNTVPWMSNSMGNGLFYSNGVNFFNKNNGLMQGAISFNAPYDSYTDSLIGNTSMNGLSFYPFPNDTMKYYIIHQPEKMGTTLFWGGDFYGWCYKSLYYSVIDMSLNNGLGDMTLKKVALIENDTLGIGGVVGTRHGNGKDWWLIVPRANVDSAYIFLLTDSGFVQFPSQGFHGGNIGGFPFINNKPICRFSPDGTKFGAVFQRDTINIYDFDRCTGELNNRKVIPLSHDCVYLPGSNPFSYRDFIFSNNGLMLYVSLWCKLYQYNLTSNNIPSTSFEVYSTSVLSI